MCFFCCDTPRQITGLIRRKLAQSRTWAQSPQGQVQNVLKGLSYCCSQVLQGLPLREASAQRPTKGPPGSGPLVPLEPALATHTARAPVQGHDSAAWAGKGIEVD